MPLKECLPYMEKRAEIIVHGRVQKAGFRDLIDEAAFNLNLNGYVKNLKDGTVQVICEGEEDKVKELLEKINIQQYPIRVEKIDVKYTKPTHEFKAFEIIREEDLSTATYERMDTAVRYMREMNANLSQKIDNLGDNLGGKIDNLGDNLGTKIDQSKNEITGEIRGLRDDFWSYFDKRLSKVELEIAEIKARVVALQ